MNFVCCGGQFAQWQNDKKYEFIGIHGNMQILICCSCDWSNNTLPAGDFKPHKFEGSFLDQTKTNFFLACVEIKHKFLKMLFCVYKLRLKGEDFDDSCQQIQSQCY